MSDAKQNSAVVEMLDVAVAAAHAPDMVVIEGVNWLVSPGEYWVVGGSPGSGKSGLLATAAGLLRPVRGVHRLFGRELIGLAEEEIVLQRLRVGMVFGQEGRLFNQLTVAENVALPVCYHRNCDAAEVRDHVEETLELTGLSSWAETMPGSVNRSLRQRIALARALALEPEVLFLDNPLREIDPSQLRWWIELLDGLCAGHRVRSGRRMTLVVVTDHFRPWLGQGEKFALIAGNRWLAIGGRSELDACDEPSLRALLQDETSGKR